MVVRDSNVISTVDVPDETNPPLVVYPNAVLPISVSFESLQAVAGRGAQVFQAHCGIDHVKLALGDIGERAPLRWAPASPEEFLGLLVGETFNHI